VHSTTLNKTPIMVDGDVALRRELGIWREMLRGVRPLSHDGEGLRGILAPEVVSGKIAEV
jgi:hypothetical protein